MENPSRHHDHTTFLFHRPGGAAPLDHLGQFLFEGQASALTVLGLLRAQAEIAVVDVRPGERCYFSEPHARNVGKAGKVLQVVGQVFHHSLKFGVGEKSLPHVALLRKMTDIGSHLQPAPTDGEFECLAPAFGLRG